MSAPSRTIRLFVSSTFSDMKAERDLLQREIFPRLRQQCLAKGLRFQPIDLRWGVSDEAGKDNRTMRICLRELRRCQSGGPKPNFLILLGDRYGWRPLPETIPAELFEKLESCLTAENAKSTEQSQEGRTTADHTPAFAAPSAGRGGQGYPKSLSVNAGEIRGQNSGIFELLHRCYRRDDNAVPPAYVLQPRQPPYDDPKVWSEQVEVPLLTALQRAAGTVGLETEAASPPRESPGAGDCTVGAALRRDKTGNRGINPLLQPDTNHRTLDCEFAALHVGLSATHQEILHGALNLPADEIRPHVHAFSRTIQLPAGESPHPDFTDRRFDGTSDPAAPEQLAGLRSALAVHITPDNVHRYSVDWRDNGQFTDVDLQQFHDDILKSLESVIAEQAKAMVSVPAAEQEENAHCAFGAERRAGFVGREAELGHVANYVAGTDTQPLLILGPAGSGKSAFMAHTAHRARENHSAALLIERYIGATPAASRIVPILHDLVQRIRAAYPAAAATDVEGKAKSADEIPGEFNPLVAAFQESLKRVTAEKPLILFLDALDQFSGPDLDSLGFWLPTVLPAGVRLVVSTASAQSNDPNGAPVDQALRPTISPKSGVKPDRPTNEAASEKTPQARVHAILAGRLPADTHLVLPPLQSDHGGQMLDRWLAAAGRTLQPEQRAGVLGTFAIEGNPLWLRTAAEETSRLTSWAPAPVLPSTTADLIRRLLERLSSENEHGSMLVERTLGYLACSRQGLSEDEILDLLSNDKEVMTAFRRRFPKSPPVGKLPVATWVPLLGDIAPFLGEHEANGASLLRFYHRVLLETVESSFLAEDEKRLRYHRAMAEYFTREARGTNAARGWETTHARGFAECVYHQVNAQSWDDVERTLSDFGFLMQKTRLGLLEGIFDDWAILDAQAPANTKLHLEISRAFFREKAHILRRGHLDWPAHKILLQLAVEHATDSPLTIGAEKFLAEDRCDWLWLRRNRRLPHAQVSPCVAVLEGHSEGVNGALLLPDSQILSWSDDSTLRLWDARNGKELVVIEGRFNKVSGALLLPDERILYWSSHCALRISDTRAGKQLAVLEGHTDSVTGALLLPDSRILSWSKDRTLRIWDARDGKELAVLKGLSYMVDGAMLLPDERILSWATYDPTLWIWDARNGKALAVLKGNSGIHKGVLLLAQDKRVTAEDRIRAILGYTRLPDSRILSWSDDNTLRIWDTRDGKQLAVLKGHSSSVTGALLLPDSRILSWARYDANLRIWNARNGETLVIIHGHSKEVYGALLLPDSRILSWSGDSTLRIWDARDGKPLAVLEGHTSSIYGALLLPDSRILSWSDDSTLRIWDARDGKPLAIIEGHYCRYLPKVLLLPDSRILSWAWDSEFKDCTLRVLDPRNGKPLTVLKGHTGKVAGALLLPDSRILSWACDSDSKDHTLRIWDARDGKVLHELEGHSQSIKGTLLLPDSRVLTWTGFPENTLRIWDVCKGKTLAVFKGHSGKVAGARLLSENRILSWANYNSTRFGSQDYVLRIWDARDGKELHVLEGHSQSIAGTLLLPDSRILSWSWDATLRVWDARDGKPLAVLKGHTLSIEGALLLPDSRILSWSGDSTLRLWDARDGKELHVLEGHVNSIEGVLLLPDSRILSWAKDDRTLRIWNVSNGNELAVLRGDSGEVAGAMLLPDDRILSWAKYHSTLHIWDARDGEELAVLKGHTLAIHGALLLPDSRILSWSSDNTLRIWDIRDGRSLEMVTEDCAMTQHPEWIHARSQATSADTVVESFFVRPEQEELEANLYNFQNSSPLCRWNTDTPSKARCLTQDGSVVFTQQNGQVCFLQLHHGNRRISIAELERMVLGDPPPTS